MKNNVRKIDITMTDIYSLIIISPFLRPEITDVMHIRLKERVTKSECRPTHWDTPLIQESI